jgi:hypothetical protein
MGVCFLVWYKVWERRGRKRDGRYRPILASTSLCTSSFPPLVPFERVEMGADGILLCSFVGSDGLFYMSIDSLVAPRMHPLAQIERRPTPQANISTIQINSAFALPTQRD